MNFDLSFDAIGTHWRITSEVELARHAMQMLTQKVQQRVELFDKHYSRFKDDSLVTTLSRQTGTFALPPDGFALLSFYEQLYKVTSGRVTPLIGQAISDAGYDARYSFQAKALAQPPNWEDVIRYNEREITMLQAALLDFGAAGKGYLVDIVGSVLQAGGLHSFTINAGGDILHKTTGDDTISIGLENPFNTDEVIGIVSLRDQSICASAGSKRKWGNYTHIIDPNSLESPKETQATWVIADTAMLADGLATALFFTDHAILHKQFDFSYALLRQDMSLEYSHEFPVTINKA